ncbi:hypothetical protein CSUI_006480 [Cystoisospora suis]|uniref:Uncharacterized protein n=1 Tax=Cystoisospora suis TaxID=483139 RepID=A0A2C6KGR9_9APIC|nr:hypothetical protein CSUI_006480 [Cystoisospora suis]
MYVDMCMCVYNTISLHVERHVRYVLYIYVMDFSLSYHRLETEMLGFDFFFTSTLVTKSVHAWVKLTCPCLAELYCNAQPAGSSLYHLDKLLHSILRRRMRKEKGLWLGSK